MGAALQSVRKVRWSGILPHFTKCLTTFPIWQASGRWWAKNRFAAVAIVVWMMLDLQPQLSLQDLQSGPLLILYARITKIARQDVQGWACFNNWRKGKWAISPSVHKILKENDAASGVMGKRGPPDKAGSGVWGQIQRLCVPGVLCRIHFQPLRGFLNDLVVQFPLSVVNLELLQMSAKIPSFQSQTRISRRLWMQRSSPTSVQDCGCCCPFYLNASLWTCLVHHKFIKWTFPTRLWLNCDRYE